MSDIKWQNDRAWMHKALELADKYLPHGEVMGEDFQDLPGIGKPVSQHSWGRLVSRAKKLNIIRDTGIYRQSRRLSNKDHVYAIYWRESYPNPPQFGDDEFNPFRNR
jgi:hypothetical protein